MEITILKDILESNKNVASEVNSLLKEKGVYMIDMMSSPGSGKTTLNDKLIERLSEKYKIAVIEGDIKTTHDAEKLAKHNIPIVQIETDRFGGDCHLESSWILKSIQGFDLDELDLVIVENIGNLVCPAEFELGDDERMVVLSVTEGEDKPIKYPLVFNTSKTIVVTKIDLLPYLDYDMNLMKKNLKEVNPKIEIFEVSATKGDGLDKLVEHISQNIEAKKNN